MITREVEVVIVVRVTVDETKFTPEFMAEFAAAITNYDTVEEHVENLAWLHARGIVEEGDRVEGYGPLDELGVGFTVTSEEQHLLEEEARS